MDWRKKPRKKKSKIWVPSKEEFLKVVKENNSLASILKHFNLETSSSNYRILKNRLFKEKIEFNHIKLGLDSNKNRDVSWLRAKSLPIKKVLVKHSSYDRTRLKRRLLKEGLLDNICYECGLGPEWNGKPLSLQIDHINGISDDNRLSNLQILCPNCHAQTETFGGKRLKNEINRKTSLQPKNTPIIIGSMARSDV